MAVPTTRCIVHLDMDCFYAQVEGVRLGIDSRTTPFALLQWESFIAVNYPARALGVRRFHDTPVDVAERFPQVRMSHIATLAPNDTVPNYPTKPLIQTHKVSLKPYRDASRNIFHILRNSEPGMVVGKAGIDEAYLDVTEAAQMELVRLQAAAAGATCSSTASLPVPLDALRDVLDPETKLIADRSAEMEAFFASRGTTLASVYDEPMRALKRREVWPDGEGSRSYCVLRGCSVDERAEAEANTLLLCAASRVVARLRARIYADLHYDCSAGIAHNRLLAKCISAAHKPRQQTLLLPDRSASALFDLPLDKVRGFGGKLGDAVREICGDGSTLCRDVWLAPRALFALVSGDMEDGDEAEEAPASTAPGGPAVACGGVSTNASAGASIFFRLRGFSGDAVTDPKLPSAVEAGKIFHPACASLQTTRQWLTAITADLADRFADYAPRLSTRGRMLSVRLTPYPRRRPVLKSKPKALPDTEAVLPCTVLADVARAALLEILASLDLAGALQAPCGSAKGESRDGAAPPESTSTTAATAHDGIAVKKPADNALPIHQLYVTVSCLRLAQADPLRHTPTLQSLFSSSAAAVSRGSQKTTTDIFFAVPRTKRARSEEADVVCSNTARAGKSSARVAAPIAVSKSATLDAFCRASPAGSHREDGLSCAGEMEEDELVILSPSDSEVFVSLRSSADAPSSSQPRLSCASLEEVVMPKPRHDDDTDQDDASVVIIDDSD